MDILNLRTVFSRIEAAASIKIYQNYSFYVMEAFIYGIFCNNPGLSNMVSAL